MPWIKFDFMKIYDPISISCILVGCCIFAATEISRIYSGPIPQDKISDVSSLAKEKRREDPRIVIDIQEEIEGVKDAQSASHWLKEKAVNYGIRIVELDIAVSTEAKRAAILGRNNEANLRKEGIISNYDYLIRGRVFGNQKREAGLYGSKEGIRFSLGMDMSLLEASTGAAVVTIALPPQDILVRNITSKQAASREAINRLMEGNEEAAGADELLHKMESHWMKEKDLGELYHMEFIGLNLEKAHLLEKTLTFISGINDPKVCSVDAAGVSVLECRSKLNSLDLASLIQKTITGFKLDRSEAHYLSFRENGRDISVLENARNNDVVSVSDGKEVISTKNNSHVIIEVKSSPSLMDKFLEPFFVKLGGFATALVGCIVAFFKKRTKENKSNLIKNE